jgi:hypothetical protein
LYTKHKKPVLFDSINQPPCRSNEKISHSFFAQNIGEGFAYLPIKDILFPKRSLRVSAW